MSVCVPACACHGEESLKRAIFGPYLLNIGFIAVKYMN